MIDKNYLYNISFPDEKILEITFLDKSDFYSLSLKNNNYIVIGGDENIETNIIGIAENDNVYYITTDDLNFCYISINIQTFIKQLLLFRDYVNHFPKNPDDKKISELTENFKLKILELDINSFYNENTFWSQICEEMEYGIII